MSLALGDLQFFYLAVIAFAVIGIQRGWRREVVSLVFILTGVMLLLYFGLGPFLAQFFFVRLPVIIQLMFSGSPASSPPPLASGDPRILFTTIITFIVIVVAGYLVGNRVFPKPAAPQERILGIIPAVIAGFVLVAYVATLVGGNINFLIQTPTSNSIGSYLSIIFVIVLVALVLGLIVASARKKSAPPAKK